MSDLCCENCARIGVRTPIRVDSSGGSGSGDLGESYIVLPQHQRRGGALPVTDLSRLSSSSSSPPPPVLSRHEHFRAHSRLQELSELFQTRVPDVACGVPLCNHCSQKVLNDLKSRLDEAYAEGELLQGAFAELEAGEEDASDDMFSDADYEREHLEQQHEEDALRAAVGAAKQERTALREELCRLRKQREQHAADESTQHEALNAAELERQAAAEEALRASQLVALCERELRRLQRVDVLSDVFRIEVGGAVGSINELHLGRLPTLTVEWAEINAALGQVVLLVVTLARQHDITFKANVLVPHGSFSKVYRLQEPRVVYELHASGSASFGRLFGAGRFEKALAMLLTCIGELLEHAAARPRAGISAQPPHPLSEVNSGFLSSAVEGKCLLQNLSWLLAWTAASRVR